MIGLSARAAGALVEAGEFCLLSNSHTSGVKLQIDGIQNCQCILEWDGELTTQMKATWNDLQDATESGAVALAILVAINFTNYIVVERSFKGTGFDYFLGHDDTGNYPFERKARLEVSGIWKGARAKVRERLKVKTKQVSVSNHMKMPAYVGIVEFGYPSTDLIQV